VSFSVPDAIEPLVGYREWHAWTDLDGKPLLRSLYRPAVWPRDEAMRASCMKNLGLWVGGRNGDHRAPSEECQCGLYAYRSTEFEPCAQSAPHRYVSGIVLGWGRYVLGTHGWRAEYARPVAILASPGVEEWVEFAATLYDLDVLDSWSQLRKVS
jgi:hypothetical protein